MICGMPVQFNCGKKTGLKRTVPVTPMLVLGMEKENLTQ